MSKYLEESYDSALKEIEQLKIKLARYEKALKECKEHCSHRDWIIDIVEEALKERP